MNYQPSNGRVITSEVLMKLEPGVLPKLPVACKTCPSAMWQITGKPDRPEAVTVRCYCPMMHTFTWDSRNQEEILDCDHLYESEEDEGRSPSVTDPDDVPPFLRQQQERGPARIAEVPVDPNDDEFAGFEVET
ncbi:hypothetical protein D3C84_441070 [compost metagenome]